jgi:hypothetical protein
VEGITSSSLESCVSSTAFPPFILYSDQTDFDRHSKITITIKKEDDEDGLYLRLKSIVKRYNYEVQILRVLGREEVANRSQIECNELRIYLQKQIRIAYNQDDEAYLDSIIAECGATKSGDEYVQKTMNFVYDDAKKYKAKLKAQMKHREDFIISMRDRNRKTISNLINLTSEYQALFHIRVRAQKLLNELNDEIDLKNKMLLLVDTQSEELLNSSGDLNATYLEGLHIQRKNILSQSQKFKNMRSTILLLLQIWVQVVDNPNDEDLLNRIYYHLLLITQKIVSLDLKKFMNHLTDNNDEAAMENVTKSNMKIGEIVKRLEEVESRYKDDYDDSLMTGDMEDELTIYNNTAICIGQELRKLLYKFKVEKSVDKWVDGEDLAKTLVSSSSTLNLLQNLKDESTDVKATVLPKITFSDEKMKAVDTSKMSDEEINDFIHDVYDEIVNHFIFNSLSLNIILTNWMRMKKIKASRMNQKED